MSASFLIVGAGITGLATAHSLVRRGHAVTILDRGPIPNPRASSFDRHRLIRPHYPDAPVYARRIGEAFDAWDALWVDLGSSHYVETGVISVSLEEGDWTARARTIMDETGEPYEVLDPAAFAARFPQFAIPDMAYALYTPRGGALLADEILRGYVGLLRAAGATLVEHADVTKVDPAAGRVTCRDGRVFQGDAILVAPGVGAPELFAGLVDVPLVPRRSVLAYVQPSPATAAAWATSPSWVDLGGVQEFWGIPPMRDIPLKLGLGPGPQEGDPDGDRNVRPEEIRALLDAYRTRVKDIDGFTLVEGHANWWTLAPDERFVFTREDKVFLLSACSGHGFKFGALTGEDVARAMTGEEEERAVAARLSGRT